jgi:hypothetical protein
MHNRGVWRDRAPRFRHRHTRSRPTRSPPARELERQEVDVIRAIHGEEIKIRAVSAKKITVQQAIEMEEALLPRWDKVAALHCEALDPERRG